MQSFGQFLCCLKIETTDVIAVEKVIDNLLEGDVGNHQLFLSNYIQLCQLCQLALEYTSHLVDCHMKVLPMHEALATKLDRYAQISGR